MPLRKYTTRYYASAYLLFHAWTYLPQLRKLCQCDKGTSNSHTCTAQRAPASALAERSFQLVPMLLILLISLRASSPGCRGGHNLETVKINFQHGRGLV